VSDNATVYIVDDDAMFARGLARLLSAAGWSPRAYSTAADFLEAVQDSEAGCVLLDVRMPGMKGPELYRTMLGRGIRLPVIFLTGHGDVPTSVDAMKMGAVDFLEKPVESARLVACVRLALEHGAAQRRSSREREAIEARIGLLTPRERELMGHVISGRLNKQIAADLGISLKTVKAHRAKVMHKMDARSVPALVEMCRTAGVSAIEAKREARVS
jgi:FixJ family two-component response regulator